MGHIWTLTQHYSLCITLHINSRKVIRNNETNENTLNQHRTFTFSSAVPRLHGIDQNSPTNPSHQTEMQHHLNLPGNRHPRCQLQTEARVALANLEYLVYELEIPYDQSCKEIQFYFHIQLL